jgi:pimeloyl-ACP methyl ester carboxylesterase
MASALSTTARAILVEVDGGNLYVEVAGSGPPVLMIHGWALDHRLFDMQVRDLSDRFQLITFDRRGFGRSTAPPDLRRELEDIDCLLNALGLDQVHLLGMSQGGRIASRFAVSHGHRLRSLTLQGAAVDGPEIRVPVTEVVPMVEYAALAARGRMTSVRERWLAHPMMRLDGASAQVRELVECMLQDYSGADLIAYDPDSYGFERNVLQALTSFSRPTLILTGSAESASRQAYAKLLLQHIPDSSEVMLAGCGHLCNLTSADTYNAALSAFLVRIG